MAIILLILEDGGRIGVIIRLDAYKEGEEALCYKVDDLVLREPLAIN